MASKREIAEHLTADELRAVVDRFELEVEDRRARGGLVDAIVASRKVDLEPVLADLAQKRLKELCRKLDLDDSGREKAALVARLLGTEPASVRFVLTGAWEFDPTVATGAVKLGKNGRLKGTFKIKQGDSSTFIAERTERPSVPIPPPPSPRDKWRRRW